MLLFSLPPPSISIQGMRLNYILWWGYGEHEITSSFPLLTVSLKRRVLVCITWLIQYIRVVFPKELVTEKIVDAATFSRKLIVICPFMSQKTLCMTFCTDHCDPNFFLPANQCISSPFSTHAPSGKPIFSQFVNIFWQKYASLYTLHILP